MPGVDCCYVVDCSSHVRTLPRSHLNAILGNYVLITITSVAIWDRNKVVVTLTVIVWGASIGFHLYGKFPPLTPVEDPEF